MLRRYGILAFCLLVFGNSAFADYTIDYGDGTSQTFSAAPWSGGSFPAIASHSYANAGIYEVTLSAELDCDGDGLADAGSYADSLIVIVGGVTQSLDFGDGSPPQTSNDSPCSLPMTPTNHSYSASGSYTAVYRAVSDNGSIISDNLQVDVSGADHFAIIHDGSAVNCQAEPVRIEAHDPNHAVIPGYTGTLQLSTSTGRGTWSLLTGVSANLSDLGNGHASYVFDGTENGVVILGLKDLTPEVVDINLSVGAAVEGPTEDPALVFAASGFNFLADAVVNNFATQIGGKSTDVAPAAQLLELQAIRTSDATGACEAALTGNTSVELAYECLSPTNCSANSLLLSGTALVANDSGNTPLGYTGISLDFGDALDQTASFNLNYADVGQLRLHARYQLPDKDGNPSGIYMSGSSGPLTFRPFAFDLAVTGNPAASSSAGAQFVAAGTDFTVNARAVLWQPGDDPDANGVPDQHLDTDPANSLLLDLTDNPTASNFDQPVVLAARENQPTDQAASLAGTTIIATMTGGSGSTVVQYDEVGIIELGAKVSSGDYLGIGAVETDKIQGKTGYVGRFYPARYAVTAASVFPACSAFTYARQPFTGLLTIEARNAKGVLTQEYRGGFVTLDPATELSFVNSASGAAYDATAVSFLQNFDNGQTGSATLDLEFRYDMPLQAETISEVRLTAVSDEVSTLAAAPVSLGSSEIRYGRLNLKNAYGSELVPLQVAMHSEYFNGSGFILNTDDHCTTGIILGPLTDVDSADGLLPGDTCVFDTGSPGLSSLGCAVAGPVGEQFSVPPSAGDFNLWFQPSGAGNEGSLDLATTVPAWLQYDWSGSGLANPHARLTFGVYKGRPALIYQRETY